MFIIQEVGEEFLLIEESEDGGLMNIPLNLDHDRLGDLYDTLVKHYGDV